jgi:two-component system NarL family sensor kinase
MTDENPIAAGERRVAWLRIAAVGLIVAAERLPHPNPNRTTFHLVAVIVLVYAIGALLWAYLGTPTRTLSLAATTIDVLSISVLAYLSGGPFSDARLAYFLIPISVAFRFGWRVTLIASLVVVVAYDIQAVSHPARHLSDAANFVAVQTGYLIWIGAAATLFSDVLTRRTQSLIQLASGRRQLLADVMSAEERERRRLAEALHDNAIQNLLAARQDIEDAAKSVSHPDLDRAQSSLTETLSELRGAIFELHPHVLDQAGLEAALRAIAERASRHAGFDIDLHIDYPHRHPNEALLLGAAREFLGNAAKHSHATAVTIRLTETSDSIVLSIEDNGIGFDVNRVSLAVAEAHIGLLSQRERIQAAGGRLDVNASPGRGTAISIWLSIAGRDG